VERVVDLDAVLTELLKRREAWQEAGIVAGPVTWRDASAEWPQPIVSDRALVKDPESLGLILRAGDDDAELVLWRGGWADLGATIGGAVFLDVPQFSDLRSCLAIIDDLVSKLRGVARPGKAQ
jgi:hypothetical protein